MDFKKERMRVSNIQNMNIGAAHTMMRDQQDLKNMDNSRNFNRDTFNKGEEWYKSGLLLQDAPEELRKNIDFVKGFERGKRIALITNLDNNKTR